MNTIGRFINGKHAKKALISKKNLRKNSSPICSIFIPENFIVKNNEITFLGRKRERSGHRNKIYTGNGTVHISSPEVRSGICIKNLSYKSPF